MSKRKPKYVIPPDTKFGGLPKKVDESEREEQVTKRDKGARRRECVLQYLGVNGLHFKWGFVRINYTDLEQSTIDSIFTEWIRQVQQRGAQIANDASHKKFAQRLAEYQVEFAETTDYNQRAYLNERIEALKSLCNASKPRNYQPRPVDNDNFEDWFPSDVKSSLAKSNLVDVSQDIIDLCFRYLNTKGIERAMMRRELSDKLMESKIEIPEGMTAEEYATKVMSANLPF